MGLELEPFIVAFLATGLLTPALRWHSHRQGFLDHPNERSSHASPTPRNGGIAILVGAVVSAHAFGAFAEPTVVSILCFAGAVAVLGILDDLFSLRAIVRLVSQVFIAATVVTYVDGILRVIETPLTGDLLIPFWVGLPVSLVWIVGLTNAYNFMDGVNGMAAIEAIVCAATYAILFLLQADSVGAVFCLSLAGGAAGFLVWNASGSIFMGDVGSGTFGFLFALLALRVTSGGGSFVAATLPLLPFLVDTSLTLFRRAIRRENLMIAHRSHVYQRLTDLGWRHLGVSVLYGGLAAVGATVAIAWASITRGSAFSLVFCLVAGMVTSGILVERRFASE